MIYCLLPDAKPSENSSQQFVGVDFAGDFADVAEGLADVLREEVAAQVGRQAGEDAVQGFGQPAQHFRVAGVSQDGLVF